MKANELMIGDWVYGCTDPYSPDEEQKKYPVKVIRIDADGDTYTMGDSPSDDPYDDEWWNLEPIPLTPEILEKNGFIKDKDEKTIGTTYHILIPTGYEANSYTIQITFYKEPICGVSVLLRIMGWIPPYNGGINDIHLCGAKYVHELQHALRLCGIDKEIVL